VIWQYSLALFLHPASPIYVSSNKFLCLVVVVVVVVVVVEVPAVVLEYFSKQFKEKTQTTRSCMRQTIFILIVLESGLCTAAEVD